MRGLLPFDGFFGDTALDHFFSDAPAAYKDYVSVPKVDIEDKKDFYEITCDMPGFTKDQISISYACLCSRRMRDDFVFPNPSAEQRGTDGGKR